jgi:hypothetical protein
LYGDFVWVRRKLNSQKRRFAARADCLMAIHFGLALQEICVATLPGGANWPRAGMPLSADFNLNALGNSCFT